MYLINSPDQDIQYQNNEGDTLLGAALREQIGFPYECNSGGCGACKFELKSGQVEEIMPEAEGLSARDRRKGRLLACQCKAKSDLEISIVNPMLKQVPYSPQRLKAKVEELQWLSEEMFALYLRTDRDIEFISGQYFMLEIEGVGIRAYSAANSVNGNQLTFIIKMVPGGKVSNLLAQGNLQQLTIDGPYGTSYLQQGEEKSSVFIAGGSGIAPMLSMVSTLLEQGYKKPIKVFYGSRLEQELLIAGELFSNASNLQLVNVLSNADENSCWGGEKGFVHEVLERYVDDFKHCEFYLCGPPPMIKATQRVLMLENQVPFEQIHFDRFF